MTFYSEKQKFTQWWIWLLIAFITLICTWGVIQQLVFKIPFGNNPASDEGLIVLGMVPLFVVLMFNYIQLETEITDQGIFYRFRPFHMKKHLISWTDIDKCYVREYKPVKEYGGWGIKYGRKSGKAYNVSGNMGLQLVMKDGKKLLLGTRKPEDLQSALTKVKRK